MQFDLCRNQNPKTRDRVPYLLDVQADLLDRLQTRVVIPVMRAADVGKPARHLNPVFEIDGVAMMLMTPELAGVSVRNLGEKIASLQERRDEIIAALDFLLTGV
jgi:toxin CcdB